MRQSKGMLVGAAMLAMFVGGFGAVRMAEGCSVDVAGAMEWSSRDHGFNEGAVCGANALVGTVAGVPIPGIGLPILGNTWDRTNMMYLARAAYRAGFREQAINAALCSQIHNASVYVPLQSCRAEIEAWFESK